VFEYLFDKKEDVVKKSWLFLLTVVVLTLSTGSAFGLQMIVNGNFEIGLWAIPGVIPSWNADAGDFGAFLMPNAWPGHSELDDQVAFLVSPHEGVCLLSQSFVIPAGMSDVNVDFQYLPISDNPFDFVSMGMLYDIGGGPQYEEYVHWFGPGTPYWQGFHAFHDISMIPVPIQCALAFGTIAPEGGGSTGLFVDNVSVEATPEPGTLLLLGSGLLGMGAIGAFRRRRK